MMKRSFRDAWSEELRSDRHEQGMKALNKNGKKCCLGVRCAMDVEAGTMISILVDWRTFEYCESGNKWGNATFPPYGTLIRWGLEEGVAEELVKMNDTGSTFSEIADYLDTLSVEEDLTLPNVCAIPDCGCSGLSHP